MANNNACGSTPSGKRFSAIPRLAVLACLILLLAASAGMGQQQCDLTPCSGSSGDIITYTCSDGSFGQIDCCKDDPCISFVQPSCAGGGQCFYYDSCDQEYVLIGACSGGA